MARGWESKSVEDQQAEFTRKSDQGKDGVSESERTRFAERDRMKLARANVKNQLQAAQNPRYIELLKEELAELDRRISAQG
jgi:hypothetical protein